MTFTAESQGNLRVAFFVSGVYAQDLYLARVLLRMMNESM
jgi:hypothetical protein